METATATYPLQHRLMTAEELMRLPEDDRFELIEGAFSPMAPPGGFHGNTTIQLSAYATVHVVDHDLGAAFAAETGFLVARDPDTVLAPDFAFIAKERVPHPIPSSYTPVVPDLVLETRSPSDTRAGVAAKVALWLRLGAKVVWEMDPQARILTIHTADAAPRALTTGDTLDGEAVLPGFSLSLRRVFGSRQGLPAPFLCYNVLMRHQLFSSLSRRVPIVFALLICLAPCALTGCASISNAQKAAQVSATLDEADRQFSLGHDKDALAWCDRAVAILPHSPIPYVGGPPEDQTDGLTLVYILQDHGRYPELAAYLAKAVADPKIAGNWQVLEALGDAQTRLGQTAASKATYAKALAAVNTSMKTAGATINPNFSIAKADAEWNSGDQAAAQKDYRTMIDTHADTAPLAENNLAYEMAVAKVNLPEAYDLAKKAVANARAADNDDALGTFLDTLGWVEHQMGHDNDALAHLQEAVSLTPHVADEHFHLAEIYRALGHRDEARIEYQQALSLDPSDKDAQTGLDAVKAPA